MGLEEGHMPGRKLLVVYATVYGQAEAVARRIAAGSGVASTIREVREATASDLAAADSVIVVASVHFGRHQRSMAKFVKANRERLSAMHSAFVSVSGSAVDPATQPMALAGADRFLRATGGTPPERRIFGEA